MKRILPMLLLWCAIPRLLGQVRDTLDSSNGIAPIVITRMMDNDSVMRAPAAIGVLKPNDLLRNNASDVSTVLNVIPGVLMQSSNIATNRISIRGIGARTPYGTNKIRAFYGGIPLTSGDSETTIDDLDLEQLGQIEIIKGPLSSVYGAGLGGAILIDPNTAPQRQSAELSVTYGSFGLSKHTARYRFKQKSTALALGYHKLATDGWRENSAYDREGITLSGTVYENDRDRFTILGNWVWLKAFIPSSIDQKTFTDNPRAAASTWAASKGYKQYTSMMGGVSHDHKWSHHWQQNTSVFVNYKDNYEPRPFDILGQYTLAYGARTQLSTTTALGKTHIQSFFGAEYFADAYAGRNAQNLYASNNGQGSLQGGWLSATGQRRHFYNAFAQLRASRGHFELQGGINLNGTQFWTQDRLAHINQKHRYDPILAPQLSLLYQPSARHTYYASASRGFSLPAIAETQNPDGSINAQIKPESGWNYEIGGKWQLWRRQWYAEVSLYRMDIKNLLVAQRIGDDQYVGVNAGRTLHQGVELLLKGQPILGDWCFEPYAAVSIGNYKFVEFEDRGSDYSGNRLTGVPAQKANAGLSVAHASGGYASVDFLYVDKIPLDDGNTAFADAYRLWNAKVGWRLTVLQSLKLHWAAGVNNLAQERYSALVLPNAVVPPSGTPRYFYPGLPINFFAQTAVSYLF